MSLTPARPEYLTRQLLGLNEGHPITNVLQAVLHAATSYRELLVEEISKPNATEIYPSVPPTVSRTDQNTVTFEYDGFKVSFEDHYPFVLVTPFGRDPYPLCWGANGLALSEAVTEEIHWGIFRYLGHDIAVPLKRPV